MEEIASVLLAFNERRKASDGSSHGEGLVVRGNQEHGRNKSQGELSRNKSRSKFEENEGYSILQGWGKGAHKTRMSRMEERKHRNKECSSKSTNVIEE